MRRGWLRPTMAVMGACTPSGFLTLVTILGGGHLNLHTAVWALLGVAGGVLGFCLGNLGSSGRFGFR